MSDHQNRYYMVSDWSKVQFLNHNHFIDNHRIIVQVVHFERLHIPKDLERIMDSLLVLIVHIFVVQCQMSIYNI